MSRLPLLALFVVLQLAVVAAPASAHPGSPADASSFRSRVVAVVGDDGGGIDGLQADVLGPDHMLRFIVTTTGPLVVMGYQGEPYLRFDGDGVFENLASPTAWLNRDREGATPIPPDVLTATEPDWVRVGDGPSHAWFDHRIHWLEDVDPVLVEVDAARPNPVRDWVVPVEVAGEPGQVRGRLDHLPGPGRWPWLVAAAAMATVLVAAPRRRGTVVALLLASTGLVAVRLLDDLVAVEVAGTGSVVAAVGQAAVVAAIVALASIRQRRDHPQTVPTTVLAGVGVLAWFIVGHGSLLLVAQPTTVLPVVAARAVVAIALGLAGASLVMLVLADVERRRTVPRGVVAGIVAAGFVAVVLVPSPRRVVPGLPDCAITVVDPPLPDGAPVPLDQGPSPAYGPIVEARFGIGVRGADDAYTRAQRAAILLVGSTVGTHARGDDAALAQLRVVTGALPRRLAVTPDDEVPSGSVVLTAWGLRATCPADADLIRVFVEQMAADLPLVPGRN